MRHAVEHVACRECDMYTALLASSSETRNVSVECEARNSASANSALWVAKLEARYLSGELGARNSMDVVAKSARPRDASSVRGGHEEGDSFHGSCHVRVSL